MSIPRTVRETVLRRDEMRCVACGTTVAMDGGDRLLPVVQYSLQHRRARGMGGSKAADTNQSANLLVLCGTGTTGCHGYVESHPEWAKVRGYRVAQYDDPTTVPVVYLVDHGTEAVYVLDGDTRWLAHIELHEAGA